ncbi:MAG: hypothetical protein M1822_006994 [Bathelium mastoideum]|nr:MAG: hypothetical protein M1822_006994 [Bathelium mastoideum]
MPATKSESSEGPDTNAGSSPVDTASFGPEYRSLYLLTWSSAKFKGHWGFFVPELEDRRIMKGKLIHAVGTIRDGFQTEFRRNFDLSKTRDRPRPPIEIGRVQTNLLLDTPSDGTYSAENQARDDFERFLLANCPAPGPSLRSAGEGTVSDVRVLIIPRIFGCPFLELIDAF